MVTDDSGLITIYYGMDTSEEEAKSLADRLREKYQDVDLDLHYGGQPIYYYVVSVE